MLFVEELSVSSERVVFNSCDLASLHILRVGEYHDVQIVELRRKIRIDGPITFDSVKGKVIADPDTEMTGKVIGGKIRK